MLRSAALVVGLVGAVGLLEGATAARAQDLLVDGTTVTLGGRHSYNTVRVINGGRIRVPAYNGVDRVNTGNLEIIASSIFVDATSSIDARGSGYATPQCADGVGPAAFPLGPGQGGCAVRDSGGGGAHFGNGGRGTKDCFVFGSATMCEFPQEFEEDCGNSLNAGGTACTTFANCWNYDALVSIAGQAYRHSIYDTEFGASGGDKGCRDGDGFGGQPAVGGAGGGRIVLVSLTPGATGIIDIQGTVSAAGRRGCGTGNDSGGGGAGGTLFFVGDTVRAGSTALVTAQGGLGGDTFAAAVGSPDYTDCPPGAQTGGTCDDCGGGGGGGIINIQSRVSMLDYRARFDVLGAVGGTCAICQGEAGGGAGELQLDGAFVGETCDGYDNDFDGTIDEGLPALAGCGLPSCVGGRPQVCPAPMCGATSGDTRPRLAVILDTSGSMLTDLSGLPTYGDGSVGHVGADANGDGIQGNDSKLFIAKSALFDVFAGYPEIDYALARYHQDESLNRSCQLAHWFECQSICCSYDDPRGNVPPAATPPCSLDLGGSGTVAVNRVSTDGGECINYAGSCGPPERGADFLVGFERSNTQQLMWLDGRETNFVATTTEGDYCNFAGGGDCEIRGTGPTPLAGALLSASAYMSPIRTCDPAAACRDYGVILLTDGAESCGGNPVAAATTLYTQGITTYVIGFSVLPSETAQLNAIAMAGSGGARGAYFATDRLSLSTALAEIVGRSLRFETCNNLDDNCNGVVDEGFTKYCNRPAGIATLTLCADPGELCNGVDDNCDGRVDEGVTNACGTCGAVPSEICDGVDNDCDGVIDEGGVCACAPSTEICDNLDNDCDGMIDEGVSRPCGTDVGDCTPGTQVCTAGVFGACSGTGPSPEVCDNRDNDCDGAIDGNTRPCGSAVGACRAGTETCTAGAFGVCVGSTGPTTELCDGIDNDCDGTVDDGDPGGGGVCGSSIGACRPGTVVCSGGLLVCAGGVLPAAETCNGVDDDCNGTVDDGVASTGPCGSGIGECREGALQCVGGVFTCVGARGPSAELCDGRDNDCNGTVDDGNPGGGVPCGSSVGACTPGTSVCTAGALACMGGTGPGTESCNGVDDDCDSLVDEGNPGGGGPCGATDVGECDFGALVCTAGALVCAGETAPIPERCNGLDDDCDGTADDGNPEGGVPCGDDTGECAPGTTLCRMGMLVCDGETGPMPEICDGLDNDCDGVADEGLPVGAACGSDVGECAPGVNVCRDGALVCEGDIGPTPEVCNGLDDDCNGVADDGVPDGAACGTVGGLCMPGTLRCDMGVEICDGEVGPAHEVCDCADNDCDGAIDEPPSPPETLCPSGSTCVDCQCALPCITTEFGDTCPTGRFARRTSPTECFCVMERCNATTCATEAHGSGDTRCGPDAADPAVCVCKENRCTFPCDGTTCGGGTVCAAATGRCVEDSCRGLGCPPAQRCDFTTGACVTDPCSTAMCAATEACRDGRCERSCATVTCTAGERCRGGACERDPCTDVTCRSGEVCDPSDGTCTDGMCTGVGCPPGTVCDPPTGRCDPDPCNELRCPGGERCEAGECVGERPDGGGLDAGRADAGFTRPDEHVLATGGGGCACSAGGGATSRGGEPPPVLALLAALGTVLFARGTRRRRRR